MYLVVAVDTEGNVRSRIRATATSIADALQQGVGPGNPNALGLGGPVGRPEHAIAAALGAGQWTLVYHEGGTSVYYRDT